MTGEPCVLEAFESADGFEYREVDGGDVIYRAVKGTDGLPYISEVEGKKLIDWADKHGATVIILEDNANNQFYGSVTAVNRQNNRFQIFGRKRKT